MAGNSKILIKRITREFIRPYFGKLGIAIICMIFVASSNALQAWSMKPIFDGIFTDRDEALLLLIPAGLLALALIRGATTYLQNVLTRDVENNILIDVQRQLFTKFLNSDMSLMSNYSSGKIISHFTNDVNTMRSSISSVLTNLIKEALSLIFLLGLIFYYVPKLALITFVIFPLAIYPVYYLGKRMRKLSHKTQQQLGSFTTQIDETIQGIRVVKASNTEEIERNRMFNLTENLKNLYKKSVRTDSLTSPLMEALGGVALALIVFYGGHQVINGELTKGTFVLFITAVLSAYRPMKSLTKLNNQLQTGLAAAERIFTLLDTKPKILPKGRAKDALINKGNIIFKKAKFRYPNAEHDALADISFNLKHGKTYALIGKSGSGKSTIMNLLLRFYDVTAGEITIDKHNIKDFSFKNLRSKIAYVSQDIFLFDDTIRANICYGIAEPISHEALINAAKQAEAHGFIEELEQGYDTKIGPRGNLLSGGQKQRIVLARAFLKDAPILLLDEATSALDPISEKKVQQALEKLKKNRTCLIIAHRLSTIIDADQIMILKNGRIIASGTHQELIKSNSYYQELQLNKK